MPEVKSEGQLSGYIPGFDGLRAAAVLLVMVGHSAAYRAIVPGGLGVTVFFTISGFLITTLLLNEIKRSGRIDLGLFYVRRFLRLYPELILFITLMLIGGWAFEWRATLAEKASALFYFFNYQYLLGTRFPLQVSYPWGHLWSLAVEEHFYIFFPILVALASRHRNAFMVLILALVIGPLAWRLVAWFALHFPANYLYQATDSRIDSIAWGCLLAALLNKADERDTAPSKAFFVGVPWLAIGLVLLLLSLVIRSSTFQSTFRYSLQGLGLFLCVANILFDERWRAIVRLLELKPVRYLGRISYGLYLFHLPIFWIIAKLIDEKSFWFLPIASVVSIACAAVSYKLVDEPIKPLRRRFGSHVR